MCWSHTLSRLSWLCRLFLALKAFVAKRLLVLGEAGWRRDGVKEGRKKWPWCWGGERRNLRKLNDKTNCESAGTSAAHTQWARLLFLCSVCMFCAPTHEPTYLSTLTCGPHLCVRGIFTHFLIGAAAVAFWDVCFFCPSICSVPHYLTARCHLSSETRVVLFGLWIICLDQITNLLFAAITACMSSWLSLRAPRAIR